MAWIWPSWGNVSGPTISHDSVTLDFLATFSSPSEAIRCGVAIQRALETHRRSAGFAPRVRVGIHIGEVTFQDSAPRGREAPVTARIMAAAAPDEILVSAELARAAPGVATVGESRSISAKGIEGELEVMVVAWR